MNENIKKPIIQERNLTLENNELKAKTDANLIRQKEIQSKAEVLEENGKKFFRLKKDSEEYNEYQKIREENSNNLTTSRNIDDYKRLAGPSPIKMDNFMYIPKEISEIQQATLENEIKIEEMKKNIEITANKLNELRLKLGMPETDDIPSLIDKKEYLSFLLTKQNDLESKLNFEKQKSESIKQEKIENSQKENNDLKLGLEEISSHLKKTAILLDERKGNGYNPIFENEDGLKSIALKLNGYLDKAEVKNNLFSLGNIVDNFTNNKNRGVNDNPESMRMLADKLKNLLYSVQNLSSVIQNEDERKEFSGSISYVSDKIDTAISRIIKGASALEEYFK